MKTILIIEDEAQDSSDIVRILESAEYKVYRSLGVTDGLMIAERYLPDLILLDLSDEQKTLETISRISENPLLLCIPIIPVTSGGDPGYLQELIVKGADGFLLKPVIKDTILPAVSVRFTKHYGTQEKIEARKNDPFSENGFGKHGKDHVIVNIGARLRLIKFSDIVCITAQKEYSMICTQENQNILVRRSLKTWRNILPPKLFLQIHRATIINIERIDKIRKAGDRTYTVTLKGTKGEFPFSHRYANIMRRTFPRM